MLKPIAAVLALTASAVTILLLTNGCTREDAANTPARTTTGSFALVRDRQPVAVFLVTKEQTEGKETGYFKLPGYCNNLGTLAEVIRDFNADLQECTGTELPITETDDGKTPVIRFAFEPRAMDDEDRFTITFPDSRTLLITGSAFAPRWALNHILEKFAGVRWLARSKNSAHFPQRDSLVVPRTPISQNASYTIHRDPYVPEGYWYGRANNKWRLDFGHGLSKIAFPVAEYMAQNNWPEFIFPTIDGKKFLPYLPTDNPRFKTANEYCSNWQPCLTDPRTVDEAVKNICAYLAKHPEAICVSLGVNDMGNFCQCENCKKLGGLTRTALGHPDYSDLYYTWVNRIVEQVTRQYPEKYFGLLAYREVINPPGFKLHPKIVPFICFDAQPCELDQEVMASRLALFQGWGKQAANVGWYEYGWGGSCMDLPRVYFGWQQRMMKLAYENHVRGMFIEMEGAIEDGPKKYLYNKLMWDVNLDLDATLRDWYEACVGKEAAPYLAEYFSMWEKFWKEEAVKTNWFINSRKGTYLSQGDKTYLYAVGREELPRMRKLMEQMLALAEQHGYARQRKRAGWMMREFEYSEACVYAIGGQIFPPSGEVENAEQALAYLATLPAAVKYDLKREEIHRARLADPDLGKGGFDRFYGFYVPGTLARVAPFCSDHRVLAAFKAATENPEINPVTRGLCNVFIQLGNGQPVNNLFANGSFEDESVSVTTNGKIVSDVAFSGKKSLRLDIAPGWSFVGFSGKLPTKPGNYLFSAMIYLRQEHPDVEEKVLLRASAQRKKDDVDFNAWVTPETSIAPGKWTRLSLVADVPPDRETFGLSWIGFKHFAQGDVAYIDDVIITPLMQ